MRVPTYRVTAPENNLSMILFEEAVGAERKYLVERCKNKWALQQTSVCTSVHKD